MVEDVFTVSIHTPLNQRAVVDLLNLKMFRKCSKHKITVILFYVKLPYIFHLVLGLCTLKSWKYWISKSHFEDLGSWNTGSQMISRTLELGHIVSQPVVRTQDLGNTGSQAISGTQWILKYWISSHFRSPHPEKPLYSVCRWVLTKRYGFKKTRAEQWRRLVRKMCRDLSYETNQAWKLKLLKHWI